MANLPFSSWVFSCIVIIVCLSIEGLATHHRHRYHYHHYYPYPLQPPTGFMYPDKNVQFTTQPGNCVTLQSYSPPEKACTYCVCFPDNWYNCWSDVGCLGFIRPQPPNPVFPSSPPMTIQGSSSISPLPNPTTLRPIGEDSRPTLGSIKPVGEVSDTTNGPEVELISSSFPPSSVSSNNEDSKPDDVPASSTFTPIFNEINEINVRSNMPNPIK